MPKTYPIIDYSDLGTKVRKRIKRKRFKLKSKRRVASILLKISLTKYSARPKQMSE